jgi:hypothetical protein
MALPPNTTVVCPRDGSRWYACASGSMFAGCCKLDPCKHARGCEAGYMTSPIFPASVYGGYPDLTCGSASTFYTCTSQTLKDSVFWGCCKSFACGAHEGCPSQDVTQAYMDTQMLRQVIQNVKEFLPVMDAAQNWTEESSSPRSSGYEQRGMSQNYGQMLVSSCLALLLALLVTITIWLCHRSSNSRSGKKWRTPERYILRHLRSSF